MDKQKILTVGDLRKAIEGMPDDSPVMIWAPDTLQEFARILGGEFAYGSGFMDRSKVGWYAEKAESRQSFSVMGHEWQELSINI